MIESCSTNNSTERTLGVFTRRLRKNPFVKKHFNSEKAILKPRDKDATSLDLVIGWGRKPQALKALKYANKHKLPHYTLEDGFIHSMSQGRLGATSWSLVTDEEGIYYDATSGSSLEGLINNSDLSKEQEERALNCIHTLTTYAVTKYNNAKLEIPRKIRDLNKAVLVIDQVKDDLSIPYSLASEESFDEMLKAAISENPDSDILVKVHPDVINGKRKGCISLTEDLDPRIHILSDNLNPIRLLDHIQSVYVVSSQLGFEALLRNKPVTCFGVPFYSGWGLTDDRFDNTHEVYQRRSSQQNLRVIFHAAYIDYSSYFHPDTSEQCQLEDVLEYVKTQHSTWEAHTGKIFCIGFSPWKKRFIQAYLKKPDSEIFFVDSSEQAHELGFDKTSKVCLWSSKFESEAEILSSVFDTPIWRIEDGFIRSISLGSNYAPPASLVIDKQGLYFDATRPSDLEIILERTEFTSKQLREAEQIQKQLIEQAISKYNVGERGVENLFSASNGKRKLLVPGQVADDASILKGCRDINDNALLLETVKEANPDAYIIYKPHPDVLSGNRQGHVQESLLTAYVDQVIIDISITDCLDQIDEVHTMTSLVGFEALMRDLQVYCYGIPFYSNWGLTVDRHRCDRRTRTLTLPELIAGTLIQYPLYMNWDTNAFTTAPHVANMIHQQLQHPKKASNERSVLPKKFRKYFSKKKNLLSAILRPGLK